MAMYEPEASFARDRADTAFLECQNRAAICLDKFAYWDRLVHLVIMQCGEFCEDVPFEPEPEHDASS